MSTLSGVPISASSSPLKLDLGTLHLHASALRTASVVKFCGARLLKRRPGGTGSGIGSCAAVGVSELVTGDLWVSRGRIIDPARRFWESAATSRFAWDVEIACGGAILSPGFIDVQCNGAFGVDFTLDDVTPADIERVLARLPASGVTAICPTLVSASAATYRAVLRTVRGARRSSGGCAREHMCAR